MKSFPYRAQCVFGTSLVLLFFASLSSCKQSKPTAPETALLFESVIPRPVSATPSGMTFFLTDKTSIVVDTTVEGANDVAEYLASTLSATGFGLSIEKSTGSAPDGAIYLTTAGSDAELGDEGYELTITEDQLKVAANSAKGLFYGVQTIRQLL